jgi:hypothetical protein
MGIGVMFLRGYSGGWKGKAKAKEKEVSSMVEHLLYTE